MKNTINHLVIEFIFLIFLQNAVAESGIERLNSITIKPYSSTDASMSSPTEMQLNGEVLMMTLLRAGDVVFDVGAHVGEWSSYALKSQPKIALYSFEPVPPLYEKLIKNLKGHPSLQYLLGISNQNGESSFVYYPQAPGLSTLHRRPELEALDGLVPIFLTVPLMRLDDFCAEHLINSVDFLKIDTEGNELFVLLGAEKLLLTQSIQLIQFEYGGCYLDSKTTLKDVYEYLSGFGYAIYRLAPSELIQISEWKPELENYQYTNYLAVPVH